MTGYMISNNVNLGLWSKNRLGSNLDSTSYICDPEQVA